MGKLSVIIPTCRPQNLLRPLLQALVEQTLPSSAFEVLLILNSEGTAASLHPSLLEFQESPFELRVFHEQVPGLHAARHRGWREAVGEILVFIDDDVIPSPGWLAAVGDSFERYSSVVLVGGRVSPVFGCAKPDWFDSLYNVNAEGKTNGWYSLVDLGDEERLIDPHGVYGCNFAIRKTVLEISRGFHPDGMPWNRRHLRGDGETYVSRTIQEKGLLALYNPLAEVGHCLSGDRLTLRYLRRRAFLQGISDSYSRRRASSRSLPCLLQTFRAGLSTLLLRLIRPSSSPRLHWLFYVYGQLWHQLRILTSPSLLAWIKRSDYME